MMRGRYKFSEEQREKREGANLPKTNRSLLIKDYKNLPQILADRKLASLGDAYTNFVYSLALSQRKDKPSRVKMREPPLTQLLLKVKERIKLSELFPVPY